MRRLTLEEVNNRIPEHSRLKCIERLEPKSRFICSCGKEKLIRTSKVYFGEVKSCGCLLQETSRANIKKALPCVPKKYSVWNRKLYAKWQHMINRCYNPLNQSYKYYGAKGVTVCQEWRESYEAFHNWAIQSGWEPHLNYR